MKRFCYSLVLLLFFGCATTQNINTSNFSYEIDSYGTDASFENKNYILVPFDSTYNGNYLLYSEFEDYVKAILKTRGYKNVTNEDSASYIVYFTFGTSGPQFYERDVYNPIYSRIGSETTINSASITKYYPGFSLMAGQASISSQYKYGVVGYKKEKEVVTYYYHYIILSAFEKKYMSNSFSKSIRWKLIGKLNTTTNDIRLYFPYVAGGTKDFIGNNSGYRKTIMLEQSREYLNRIYEIPVVLATDPVIKITTNEEKINFKKRSIHTLKSFKNLIDVIPGNVVAYDSPAGEKIYGIVSNCDKRKITISIYPTPGFEIKETKDWKNLFEIIVSN